MIPAAVLEVGRYYVVRQKTDQAEQGPFTNSWLAAGAMRHLRLTHYVGYWSPGWQRVIGI